MNKQITLLTMEDLEGIVGGNIEISSESASFETKSICTASKEPEMTIPPSTSGGLGASPVTVKLNTFIAIACDE